MCGIWACLHASQDDNRMPSVWLDTALQRRGPDHQTFRRCRMESYGIDASTHCTVLSLRGQVVVPQPMVTPGLGELCWNGEAWKIGDDLVNGNDTEVILDLLTQASKANQQAHLASTTGPSHTEDHILKALASIRGPFAFVYFCLASGTIYFGRDYLGRRSLLLKRHAGLFVISSVSDETPGWTEVSADSIHVLRLERCDDTDGAKVSDKVTRLSESLTTVPWSSFGVVPRFNDDVTLNASEIGLTQVADAAVDHLEALLRASMGLRTVLPMHVAGEDTNFSRSINLNGSSSTSSSKPARLAILFSGGLDCSLLARLAHDVLGSDQVIDLLNVAFENPHVHDLVKLKAENRSAYDLCPDRVTARASYQELQKVCSTGRFRLIEVNVPYTEAQRCRETVIKLMAPHNTQMDLSISLALYFASRGTGVIWQSGPDPYSTSAKVLLSGLGADELFAGYQRHATAFKHRGDEGLLKELKLDFERLGQRNLGRDDRITSHWGKEVRYPFLDEDLVRWAVEAPLSDKCGFGVESDDADADALEPAKLVLRLLARKLGMPNVAKEKKRAIQFGARTAKMEGKTTGTASIHMESTETGANHLNIG